MEVWDIFRDCKSGIDFENTVVKFLRCLAFEANRTGKDDGGIDIVATTSILPQCVSLGDPRILLQLVHDLIHHRLQRCLQISVLLLALGDL